MKKVVLATAIAILGIVALACGGDDSGGTQTATKTAAVATSVPATSAPATGTPASSQTGTPVDVQLQEWAIIPSKTSVPAGDVTFNVKNIGPDYEHEFVILKTDLTPAALPKRTDAAIDEEAAEVTSPGEIAEAAVGATASKTFTLTPGHYIFVCNLINQDAGITYVHFTEGMHAEFTVQ